nr:MAG TPA_asm: hypothetical protein [Caudoviricetes sp.]
MNICTGCAWIIYYCGSYCKESRCACRIWHYSRKCRQ